LQYVVVSIKERQKEIQKYNVICVIKCLLVAKHKTSLLKMVKMIKKIIFTGSFNI